MNKKEKLYATLMTLAAIGELVNAKDDIRDLIKFCKKNKK
mgnify:CR=1 FL=1